MTVCLWYTLCITILAYGPYVTYVVNNSTINIMTWCFVVNIMTLLCHGKILHLNATPLKTTVMKWSCKESEWYTEL